ncbi:hypothetical protein [Vagococcus fluvialis]|uniref:hypothetical protein n=1 Tax=Vagococcus fluvialis TaxID=2738 RepID=UPI003B2119E7
MSDLQKRMSRTRAMSEGFARNTEKKEKKGIKDPKIVSRIETEPLKAVEIFNMGGYKKDEVSHSDMISALSAMQYAYKINAERLKEVQYHSEYTQQQYSGFKQGEEIYTEALKKLEKPHEG